MIFEEFFERLDLQHFRFHELLKHTECEGNTEPPRPLWDNIVPTILVLDKLREHLNVPIYLTSTYRAPAYNKRKNGRKRSLHQAFSAVDFKADNVSPQRISEILKEWRGQWFQSPVPIETSPANVPAGQTHWQPLNTRNEDNTGFAFQFKGGIGSYTTYVHIDTRGINNTWKGR